MSSSTTQEQNETLPTFIPSPDDSKSTTKKLHSPELLTSGGGQFTDDNGSLASMINLITSNNSLLVSIHLPII